MLHPPFLLDRAALHAARAALRASTDTEARWVGLSCLRRSHGGSLDALIPGAHPAALRARAIVLAALDACPPQGDRRAIVGQS